MKRYCRESMKMSVIRVTATEFELRLLTCYQTTLCFCPVLGREIDGDIKVTTPYQEKHGAICFPGTHHPDPS